MRPSPYGRKGTAFPMHRQPYLDALLKQREGERLRAVITDALAESDECDVTELTKELALPQISIREKVATTRTWVRQMQMGANDYSGVLQSLYPGDRYEHVYSIYDLMLDGSEDLVSVGVNGGQFLDPMFVEYQHGRIEIRAASDQHRDELISQVEGHIQKANDIIQQWNAVLPQLVETQVRAHIERRRTEAEAAVKRQEKLAADGFVAEQTPKPAPAPLKDLKRSRQPPAARPPHSSTPSASGVPYRLTEDQFVDILDAIRTYQDDVESRPGAGAPSGAKEDQHRDSLLAALNMRFQQGSAEAFSRHGKTDIQIVVADHCIFSGECKIWSGLSSVTAAFEQLVGRYLIRRDNHGALIFFIRGISRPEEIPPKVIEHLETELNGKRQPEAHGYPILRFVTDSAGTVDLALIFIQVDSAM